MAFLWPYPAVGRRLRKRLSFMCMRNLVSVFFMGVLMVSSGWLYAQQSANPYHMNGNAIQENCNCYTITPDDFNKSGSVWNINRINLNNSFDYRFDVSLGCQDADGADGLAFVLQPISVSIGSTGEGLGIEGIKPSIAVAIDTWQNGNQNDPAEDHIAIHKNGDLNHNGPNNLAGPVSALANSGNIEDCQVHSLRITWDAATKTLSADIDGVRRVTATVDMVPDIFGNDPLVYWGFTGSTGSAKNLQRFCTSLNAAFTLPADLSTCFPAAVPFMDSSSSFGNILKWHWDFGDGTSDTVKTPVPHQYAAPGNYDVRLSILGNNGCISDTFVQRVIIGSKPEADFAAVPAVICDDQPVSFEDRSSVQYGTIDRWQWDVAGRVYNTAPVGPLIFNEAGTGIASLIVSTREGCVSQMTSKTFQVFKTPEISFTTADVCLGTPAQFNAVNHTASATVSQWNWNLGDGTRGARSANHSYSYKAGGVYSIKLSATSDAGCVSETLSDTVHVYATKANAGVDTILATGQSYQLQGSGGEIYSWSPATVLSNPAIANPVATFERDTRLTLTASTSFGCATTDEVYIKVYKGPAIYVPNVFTPNGDGKNDRFRAVAVGMKEIRYFRIYNRYGQLIFDDRNSFNGWDGSVGGKPQGTGTFVWIVSGIDFNGQEHVKKGTVTLVR
ncbi:MAG: PKD domain-containing protein [Chitinophagaceae bacterium]|nr:MAG: PKD domain-containing protein [Chitinophagaceae bacterium]